LSERTHVAGEIHGEINVAAEGQCCRGHAAGTTLSERAKLVGEDPRSRRDPRRDQTLLQRANVVGTTLPEPRCLRGPTERTHVAGEIHGEMNVAAEGQRCRRGPKLLRGPTLPERVNVVGEDLCRCFMVDGTASLASSGAVGNGSESKGKVKKRVGHQGCQSARTGCAENGFVSSVSVFLQRWRVG